MKAYIDVPDSLSDIKLRQYQKFVKETKDNEDTDFIQNKIIEIFCNVRASDVKKIKYTDIKKISDRINKLFEEKPALVRNFNLYGVNYYFIPNLDEISLGEYIDIDTYISDWDNIHIAMNVLYRPLKQKLKEKYLIEDYNENNNTVLQDMPLDAVMSSIFFFLSFRERLTESYSELFTEQSGDTTSSRSNFSKKWGWYHSLYALTKGDITKLEEVTGLNVHKCLMMLAYISDKNDMEAKQIKSKLK